MGANDGGSLQATLIEAGGGGPPVLGARQYVHDPTVHARVSAPRHVAPPARLLPGCELVIGRDAGCDLRIPHASIAPRHLRLVWPPALASPHAIDLGGPQGTELVGAGRLPPEESTPLPGSCLLWLGPVPIEIEIRGEEEAWWNATGVEASFDDGPELSGELRSRGELARLLRDLERERRTGTLRVGEDAALVLCLGRIMRAAWGRRRGEGAARAIVHGGPLAGGPVPYEFTRAFELSEDPPLHLWPGEVLRDTVRLLASKLADLGRRS